jgi:hypothetical protein
MLSSLEVVQPGETEFTALRTGGCCAATQAAGSLMSLAFKVFGSLQTSALSILGLGKQCICSVVVLRRSGAIENTPGFINVTLSVCILWVERSEPPQRGDVPLRNQYQLPGELLGGNRVFLENLEEDTDRFAARM